MASRLSNDAENRDSTTGSGCGRPVAGLVHCVSAVPPIGSALGQRPVLELGVG